MKSLYAVLALCTLCLLPGVHVRAQPVSDPDHAAIQKLITAVPAAMNRRDWKTLADLLAEDAGWINVVGMFWHGNENVVRAHAAYASTAFRNGGFRYSNMLNRDVAPNVAVVVVTEHSNAQLALDGTQLPGGQGRLSYLVMKRNGTWKIT